MIVLGLVAQFSFSKIPKKNLCASGFGKNEIFFRCQYFGYNCIFFGYWVVANVTFNYNHSVNKTTTKKIKIGLVRVMLVLTVT